MNIKRVVSGIRDWNAIFELENGLFAMSNIHPEEPVHFPRIPPRFCGMAILRMPISWTMIPSAKPAPRWNAT